MLLTVLFTVNLIWGMNLKYQLIFENKLYDLLLTAEN